jgi:hypothetical protein
MTKQKILVLGNSPFINDIKFDKLPKDIKTFGVNRIWLKHIPDYFFFHDADILTELDRVPDTRLKLVQNSVTFTSDWLSNSEPNIPHWLRKYPRTNRRCFPDSVSAGLSILGNRILPGKLSDYIFYMAGISLRWEEPSHFWKADGYPGLNKKERSWYDIRFNKMFQNFRDIKSHGFNMISVTPNSNLNKLMRFENIANLY